MADLKEDIQEQIRVLCVEGDGLAETGDLDDALEAYWEAMELLPEPKTRWEAATLILTAIADVHHQAGEHAAARENLELALRCPGSKENAFVHLRLGQSLLELGEKDRAAEQLGLAYEAGGSEIFEDEEPQYFAFLMTRMETPPDGW